MAVYFITGKLGAGKTLSAVGRIRDYLEQGRPVATNLDIDLVKLLGPKARKVRFYRVPDKPSIDDLEAIGNGNSTYDESRNGVLVLDECGTWFNSRTWADRERQKIINWFLHARKLGWDVIFIIQSIQVVDKQARLTLAEHLVTCNRLDKFTVPFFTSLTKLFFGKPLHLPKIHVASVRYGDQPTSIVVDRWFYFGRDLYPAYDTKQAFSDFYDNGTFSVLPPWLSRGRYMVPMTWSNRMRLTKIYLRKYSKPVLAGAFFLAGVFLATFGPLVTEPVQAKINELGEGVSVDLSGLPDPAEAVQAVVSEVTPEPAQPAKLATPVKDRYTAYRIDGFLKMKGRSAYVLRSPDGATASLDAIASSGVDVFPRSNCHVRLVSSTDLNDFADVYAPNCIPDDVKPVVSNAIALLPDPPKPRPEPYDLPTTYGQRPDYVSLQELFP